jgi:hypothetical protein
MSFPPSIIRLLVHIDGRKEAGLWLPMFALWPIALVLGVMLAPLVAVLAIALWPAGYGRMLLLAGPRLFALYCSMNGLLLEVQNGTRHVYIRFA